MEQVNTKATSILCPEGCGGSVVLNCFPGKYAGIYECLGTCGSSWSCEHPAFHEETVEDDPMHPEQTFVNTSKILICDDCGEDCTEQKTINYPLDDDCEGCS